MLFRSRRCLADFSRRDRCAESGILTIHVTMSASGAYLVAAVPRIPHRHNSGCCSEISKVLILQSYAIRFEFPPCCISVCYKIKVRHETIGFMAHYNDLPQNSEIYALCFIPVYSVSCGRNVGKLEIAQKTPKFGFGIFESHIAFETPCCG